MHLTSDSWNEVTHQAPSMLTGAAFENEQAESAMLDRTLLIDVVDDELRALVEATGRALNASLVSTRVCPVAASGTHSATAVACVVEVNTPERLAPLAMWPSLAAPVVALVSQDGGLAIQALRSGVWDIVVSPAEPEVLQRTIEASVEEGTRRLANRKRIEEFQSEVETLTENEKRVLTAICEGKLNKQIAREMNVSVRTIEQRRRRVFDKMHVLSAVPLAKRVAEVETLQRLCGAPAVVSLDQLMQPESSLLS